MRYLLIILLLCAVPVIGADYSEGDEGTQTLSSALCDDCNVVQAITPSNTGTLDSAVIWLHDNYSDFTVEVVVYDSATGALIDTTSSFYISDAAGTADRYDAPFLLSGTLTSGTKYLVGIGVHETTSRDVSVKLCAETDSRKIYYNNHGTTGNPATFTETTETNYSTFDLVLWYSDDYDVSVSIKIGAVKIGGVSAAK